MRRNDFFKSLLFSGGSAASRSELETETLPYTFNSNSYKLRNYRIYGNTVNEESVGDLVTEGEHSGEYMVPVTVSNGTDTQTIPIYLTEQIRKVGDEAEYVDYKEQKQHRVRKNLLQNTATNQTKHGVTFTVNDDGSVTCNGKANNNAFITIDTFTSSSSVKVSGCPSNGGYNNFLIKAQGKVSGNTLAEDVGAGSNTITFNEPVHIIIRIASGYTCNNLTFYPMIRKADIEDDTYEPYITDTELNVTLPVLPTFPDTNTLSVGTTVQPSKVYLQGKISEAEIVSAEYVRTNVQSLQPLSLDGDLRLDVMPTESDLQLDVMPIDRSEFQINDISEVPVEDENSVKEIPETENFETSGDEENAK